MNHDSRAILNTLPALIARAANDGSVDFVNRAWLEFTGRTADDLLGWKWTSALHPDDQRAFVEMFSAAVPAKQPITTQARFRRADGEYRLLQVHSMPMFDDGGEVLCWFGVAYDIDDLKRAEDRLRLVIDTTPALIFSATANGEIDFVNQRWLEYLGVSDRAEASPINDFIHPDDVERIETLKRESVATGSAGASEGRVRGGDGEYRWFVFRTVPLHDSSGKIVRWYGSGTDVEDLKRAHDEVTRLKDQLQKENIALKQEVTQASMFEEIVGSSASLRRVLADVAKVAATDSTVLITGETGTGKELIARAIHKRSRRASRAFVSVNCGAIPTSLISSELFGHEKGAFTGALQRHLGRFELADGGTIFLDEVGELPPETQVTLLRVLQERTFERVGGVRPIPVDVRVIAATNRDLEKSIEDGGFREELYYRLNVFPVHLPPLRERVEDIALLVEYFTERYAAKVGKKISKVSRSTMDRLRSYGWPGNIRELQNVIERAVILADGDTLVVDESWLQRPSARLNSTRGLGRPTLKQEKELIESALADAGGRVAGPAGAAAKLGIPRSTLESRIRALHISKNRFRDR